MIQKPNILLIGGLKAGKSTLAAELANAHGYTVHSFALPLKQFSSLFLDGQLDKSKHRELLQVLGTDIARNPDWAFVGKAFQLPTPQRLSAQMEAVTKLYRALGFERPQDPEAADEWWDRVRATERFLYSMEGAAAPFAAGFGDSTFWVDKAITWLATRSSGEGPFVFDDCRFPEEQAALQFFGNFKTVRVDASPATVKKRAKDAGGFDPAWLTHSSEGHWRRMKYDVAVSGSGDVKKVAGLMLKELVG